MSELELIERDYPELEFRGCSECIVCSAKYSQNVDFYYAQPHGNTGIWDVEENTIYITKCAGKAVFKKIVTMIDHEYLHWIIDKLFPDEKYMFVDEYNDEYEYTYSSGLDTRLWKDIEKSLGLRLCESKNHRWRPVEINKIPWSVGLALDWLRLVDARLWFK